MKDPKLKNIIILGMFDDGKVRQLFCMENQQRAVVEVIRAMESDNIIKCLDKEIEGIEWKSDVDLTKIMKSSKFKN